MMASRQRFPATLFHASMLVALVLATGGCDTISGYFSDEEKILPGDRINVLSGVRVLQADAEVTDEPILLPPPEPNADWPQSGGSASHAMHHLQIPESITEIWSSSLGAGEEDDLRMIAPPIVADGKVFGIDAESMVRAFDAATGDDLWDRELAPDGDEGHIAGGLAYGDGRLYVTTGFAEVLALNPNTGKLLWKHRLDGPMRAGPTFRGGRLFVITLENKLYALNAQTGVELWDNAGIVEPASLLGTASPAVDQGVVIAAYSSGELVALRVGNGKLLWSDSLSSARRTDVVSSLAHIRGRPIIDRGRVYALSHAGLLVAIDLRSGRRLWDRDIGGMESPWIAGDYLYMMTNEYAVVCLGANDGKVRWVQSLPRFEDPEDKEDAIVWSGPVLASDRLLVAGTHGQVLAISPYSGKILGGAELSDGVVTAPIVANGVVYFLTSDAEVVAYR